MKSIKKIPIIIFISTLILCWIIFIPINLFFKLFIGFLILQRIHETFLTNTEWSKSDIYDRDKYLNYVMFSYVLMVFLSSLEVAYKNSTPSKIEFIGLIIFLSSIFIRYISVKALGRFWSISSIRRNEDFIRKGPYSVVRHPYYIGVSLEVISISIIMNSMISFLISILVIIPLEIKRAQIEERVLGDEIGWPYFKYINEVGMFFPASGSRICHDRRKKPENNFSIDRRNGERRARLLKYYPDRRQMVSVN